MYNTNHTGTLHTETLHSEQEGKIDVGHAVSYDDLQATNFYAVFPATEQETSAYADKRTWYASFAESARQDERGTTAARLSIEAIYKHLLQSESTEIPVRKRLESSLQHAHETLLHRATPQAQHRGYEAALLSSCITENRFYVTYSGDIRAYLFRNNLIYHLTHAVATDRKPKAAKSTSFGREIEPALVPTYQTPGAQDKLTVNHISFNVTKERTEDEAMLAPQLIDHLPLNKNDVIAICSASVSRAVPPLRIDEIAKACLPQRAAEEIINLASIVDKDPNHSIIILRQR